MRFEWDSTKDEANRMKHGLGFAEAKALFESDSDFFELYDEQHSDSEERFIAIGPIARGVVVVVWTERSDGTIRLISARFAVKHEQEIYRKYMEAT